MHVLQRTVADAVYCSGVGLHSGRQVNLAIRPAPPNHGIRFVRTDLPDSPQIPALFNRVVDTSLATVIGFNGAIVSTIEHLMASLAGLSIDNALIELDGHEVPVLDGSAGPFTKQILQTGIAIQDVPRQFFVVKDPIAIANDDKSVCVYPSDSFKITCTIDFSHQLVGKQTCSIELTDAAFENEICRARTFGFLEELEYMKQYGLAQGGSLDNAIVLNKTGVENEDGLRFQDEFVRHKLLDSIGDLSLLGMPIIGHIVLKKSGHAYNHEFLKQFLKQASAWETRTYHNGDIPAHSFPKSLAN